MALTERGMTVADLAQILGKTEDWVTRNAHRMPHHRFGRSYRFFPDDVAEILAATRHRPEPASDDELRPLPSRRRSA